MANAGSDCSVEARSPRVSTSAGPKLTPFNKGLARLFKAGYDFLGRRLSLSLARLFEMGDGVSETRLSPVAYWPGSSSRFSMEADPGNGRD